MRKFEPCSLAKVFTALKLQSETITILIIIKSSRPNALHSTCFKVIFLNIANGKRCIFSGIAKNTVNPSGSVFDRKLAQFAAEINTHCAKSQAYARGSQGQTAQVSHFPHIKEQRYRSLSVPALMSSLESASTLSIAPASRLGTVTGPGFNSSRLPPHIALQYQKRCTVTAGTSLRPSS